MKISRWNNQFDKSLAKQCPQCSQPTIACSKLTIETPRSGVFIVKFEHISHLVLEFRIIPIHIATL